MKVLAKELPRNLYTAAQTRELDRLAIEEYEIPGSTLMARAAEASFKILIERWPHAKKIVVMCGQGNNAGDGFVLARIAQSLKMDVKVILVGDPLSFEGDCLEAFENLQGTKAQIENFSGQNLSSFDVVIDALFGSGLNRDIEGLYKDAIDVINAAEVPVLALDLPSGLNSDTGHVWGCVVKAHTTVCFIGLKQGLLTGHGPDLCGAIFFDSLDVPDSVYHDAPFNGRRIELEASNVLAPRLKNSHKGHFGHVLVVGGDMGMSGAPRLTCEASLRVGSGLVSLATRDKHALIANLNRSEVMAHGCETMREIDNHLGRANLVAVGPGLGGSRWSELMWNQCVKSSLPLVVDADALNLLAREPIVRGDWILTPHPGEAARLLACTTQEVQRDRFAAVQELQKRFAAVVVLKGCGTLVCDTKRPIAVCDRGNPGMASGGMGDTLTGVIAGLVAQGLSLWNAARLGVYVHALAADQAAKNGERGLIASDLMPYLRGLVNS